jgi:hypothetical protein
MTTISPKQVDANTVINIYLLSFMIDYKVHRHIIKTYPKRIQNELCKNGEEEINYLKNLPLRRFIIYRYLDPFTMVNHCVYSSMNFFQRDITTQQIGDTTIVSPLWALKEITCHIVHLLATYQIIIWDDAKNWYHSNVKIAIRKDLFNYMNAYVLLGLDMCSSDPNSDCNPIRINFSFNLITVSNNKKYVLSNVEMKLPTLAFRGDPIFAFKTCSPNGQQTSITAAPIRHQICADKDVIHYSVDDIHKKGYIQIVPDQMIVQILQHAMYIEGYRVCVSPEFAKKLESNELTTKYEHVTPHKSLLEWKIPPIHIIPQKSTSNSSVNV